MIAAVGYNPNQTTLSWTASTETGGTIANYLVERCQGAGCTNFVQIGTTTGTTYNDIGLMGGTVYSYRVRAQDTIQYRRALFHCRASCHHTHSDPFGTLGARKSYAVGRDSGRCAKLYQWHRPDLPHHRRFQQHGRRPAGVVRLFASGRDLHAQRITLVTPTSQSQVPPAPARDLICERSFGMSRILRSVQVTPSPWVCRVRNLW